MLVIKRKASEAILIGDDIEIIVSEIYNDKVNICINAPRHIKITRKELHETQQFNEKAAASGKFKDIKNMLHNKNDDE